jgi:hypothetical protein
VTSTRYIAFMKAHVGLGGGGGGGIACFKEAGGYAGGTVASSRVTQAGQATAKEPHKACQHVTQHKIGGSLGMDQHL